MSEVRLGLLASGRGSNFARLCDACTSGRIEARPAVLVSNNPEAQVLQRARNRNVPARHVSYDDSNRKQFEHETLRWLGHHECDLVLLAGFTRVLTGYFVSRYRGRILNIHPSLLPSFKGLDAQKQALEYGVKITGCTVHLVTEELDAGPIVAQEAVRVRDQDTRESLAKRILEVEHRLYPRAVQQFIEKRLNGGADESPETASAPRRPNKNEVLR